MARSKINTHGYNKISKEKILNMEEVAKQMHADMNNLDVSLSQMQHFQYVLNNSEFKRKYIQFTKDTVIIAAKNTKKIKDKYLKIEDAEEIYNNNVRPVLETMASLNNTYKSLKKDETGTELLHSVVSIEQMNYTNMKTKANTSLDSLNNAIENLKKAKSIYVFDTETYSGMGRTGYNELDSIQEFAFRKYEKVNGKVSEIEEGRIETLIGLNEAQRNKYYELFVENYNDEIWEDNNKNRVIVERLAKLGHDDTDLDFNAGKGIVRTRTFASDDSIDLKSKENIKKGLEKSRKIWEKQDKERLENGLMVWEDYLLRSVNIFNDNFVVGYNSTNFDIEKINQEIAKVWGRLDDKNIAYYSKKLGLEKGMVPTIKPKDGMYLDGRDPVRMYAELYGKTGVYNNDVKILEDIRKSGKTFLQQETLGSVYAKDAMKISAHTAGSDVDVLAELVYGDIGNGKSLMVNFVEDINKKASSISGPIDRNAVFMATQAETFNDYTRKGALNFTHDRTTGAIRTFNGYSFDSDGTIRDLNGIGAATGLKTNVAYQIGYMGEANMSEEWIKNISKAHQDYAQGKLWMVTFNPVIDKTIAGENSILEDPVTYLFTTQEAMEGFTSSHLAHIGNKDKNGKLVEHQNKEARDAVRKAYSTVAIKDGKVTKNIPKESQTNKYFSLIEDFDINKIEDISNFNLSKARGGFWTSPVNIQGDTITSWHRFIKDVEMTDKTDKNGVLFEIDNTNVLKIDSFKKAEEITKKYGIIKDSVKTIDHERIQKDGYTGMLVTDDVIHEAKRAYMYGSSDAHMFTGWDIESLHIYDKNIIKNYKKTSVDEAINELDNESFLDNLIKMATRQAMNDPAAKTVRNQEYNKAVNFRKTQDYLIKNGYDTVEKQKRILSQITAENVASGKPLKIKHDIISILEYHDRATDKNVMHTSTMNNMINSYEYMNSLRGVIDQVIAEVDKYGDIDKDKKQYIYQTLMSGIMEDAENEFGSTNKVLNVYEKDLNYFEFNMPKGYFSNLNKKSMPKEVDNVVRLNLAPEKEYTLVNDLLRRRKDSNKIINNKELKELYGKKELINFIEEVNEMDDYKGIFDELIYGKPVNNIKQSIIEEKHKRSMIGDSIYSDFNKAIEDDKNINEAVINARKVLEDLRQERDNVYERISHNKENRDSYIKKLEGLYDEFANTIIDEDEWYSLDKDKKSEIKSKQASIVNKQEEIINKINNSREYDKLSEIEDKINNAYQNLFDAVGDSENDTVRKYKDMYKEAMSAKNKEIDALYDKLHEDTTGIIQEDIGVDALSEKISLAVRKFREANPTAGYVKDRDYQDVTTAYEHATKMDKEFVSKSIEKGKREVANLKTIDSSDKLAVRQEVEKIVDAVLMPTVTDKKGNKIKDIQKIAEYAQEEYGFNKELYGHLLELAREDHIKGMTNFLTPAIEYGGRIIYNKENRQFGLEINNEVFNLSSFGKIRFEDGITSVNDDIALMFKFNGKQAIGKNGLDKNKIGFTTNIAQAYDDLKYLGYQLNNAAKTGDPKEITRVISRAYSNVGLKVREESALGQNTAKDMLLSQHVDHSDIYELLPDYIDEIKAYKNWADKDFAKIIEKHEYSIKNGISNPDVKEAAAKNRQDLMKIMLNIGAGKKNEGRNRDEKILREMNNATRDTMLSYGISGAGDFGYLALGEFDNSSRPVINQMLDAAIHRKTDLVALSENLKSKNIDVGSRLTTKRYKGLFNRHIAGLGETETSITQTTAAISERNFKKRVLATYNELKDNGTAAEKEFNKRVFEYMTSINTTEQEKIIVGDVAKTLMSTNEIQLIGTLKDFNRDLEVNSKIMNERVAKSMPIVEVAKGADVVFELGKKSFVKKNEPLLTLNGYGDVIDVIGAKGDFGYFGYGYFAKRSNQMLTEEEIRNFLKENRSLINKREDALKLLEETFDARFYVKSATHAGYYKGIYEGGEKGMFRALLAGAGRLDDSVGKALELTGFEDIKYRILGDDFINETLKEAYNALSDEDRKTLGFKDFDELKDRIYWEQNAPTRFFNMMAGFEDVTSASVDNVYKHKNAGMVTRQMINNMAQGYIKNGMNENEAYKKVEEILKESDIFSGVDFNFKDGKIEFNVTDRVNAEINAKKVDDLIKKHRDIFKWMDVDPLKYKREDGKEEIIEGFTKTRRMLTAQHDYVGTSRSSDFTQVDEEIRLVKEKLSELDPSSEEFEKLNDNLKHLELKRKVMTNYDKKMKISKRERNLLGLHEYDGRFIEDAKRELSEERFNLLFGNITDSSGKLLEEFEGKKINEFLLNQFDDQAAEKVRSNSEYIKNGANALRFNKEKQTLDADYLLNNGFESKKISDLIFAEGTDTTFLEDNPNRAFGQNLLISTGLKSKGYDQVAVSATNYKTTGDMVNNDEVQKALIRMQNAYEAWQSPDGSKSRDELERAYMRSIDNVKDAMDTEVQKIVKDSGIIELDKYSYEKATMAVFDKDNPEITDFVYSQALVSRIDNNGKIVSETIGNLAKDNIHIAADWHGVSHFEDLGYFTEEYMKENGFKSREEVMQWLEKHGTIGPRERTPATKGGAVKNVRRYLDRTITNVTKVTASVAAEANQDQDGDSGIIAELKFEKTGDTYVTHMKKLEQEKEVSQEQIDFFNEATSAINYEAMTVNVGAYEKMYDTYIKNDEVARKSASIDAIGETYKYSGIRKEKVNTFMQYEVDSATRNDYLSKYGEIADAVKAQMGESEYDKLERLDRVTELEKYITKNSLDESYTNAIKFNEIYERANQIVMSKSSKETIGFMNTPLASLRRVMEDDGLDSTSRQYLQATAFWLEESMISRKHSASSAISVTQKVRENLKDIASGDKSKSRDALAHLKGVLSQNLGAGRLIDDIADEVLAGNSIYELKGLSDEEAREKIKQGVYGVLDEITNRFENNKALGEQFFAENANNLRRDTVDKFANGYQNVNSKSGKILAESLGGKKYHNPKFNPDGFERVSRNVVQETGEAAIQGMTSNGGSGLAKAALGVAAAVMMTGYIGGNPTVPADNHAEQMNNYDSLQDEDLSIQRLPQGAGQGYVININAQSSKGQDHAMQAIQKAMQSSVTTDINISMNINDKTSNINSRFIDKLLTGAL